MTNEDVYGINRTFSLQLREDMYFPTLEIMILMVFGQQLSLGTMMFYIFKATGRTCKNCLIM